MRINEIMALYTTGQLSAEDANRKLREAGATFHIQPGRNDLTEAEAAASIIGTGGVTGWGLLDTGTGTLDKVAITGGRLDYAVNAIGAGGKPNMTAYVYACGKVYSVTGDKLREVQ